MPDTLPFAPVARLAPSASFYTAITQPLNLKYISADPTHLVFGSASCPNPSPVFEVKCTPDGTPPSKHSRICFTALSPQIVSDFCAAALRANPVLHISSNCHYIRRRYIAAATPITPPPSSFADEKHHCTSCSARVMDHDGNIMEVAHVPEQNDCLQEGASRILDWNWDVATTYSASEAPDAMAMARRPSHESDDGTQTIYRRTVTKTTRTTTSTAPPAAAPAAPANENNGLSPGAIFGGVLGAVAAGAAIGGAITYTIMNRERERAPQQEYDVHRRSSAPNPFPQNGQRFIEVERTTERIRYPEDYAQMRRYPPPSAVARYAQGARPMSRALEDVDDRMSRAGSQHTSRTRGRSEVSASRRPLMLTDAEHRSNAGSKIGGELGQILDRSAPSKVGTSAPKSVVMADNKSQAPTKISSKHSVAPSKHSVAPSRHTRAASRHAGDDDARSHATSRRQNHRPPEAETFVSARTGKSAAPTVVPAPTPAKSVAPSRAPSKAASRHTSATRKGTGASKAGTHVSIRELPPPSHVGSVAELDDDLQSLAPSDSISCVGSRQRDRSLAAGGPDGTSPGNDNKDKNNQPDNGLGGARLLPGLGSKEHLRKRRLRPTT